MFQAQTTHSQAFHSQQAEPQRAHARRADLETADLRRRRSRELSELLVAAAEWTAPEDRAVIHAIYRDGMTARALAELRQVPARVVRRQVRRLASRLLSPRYLFVVRNRDHWPSLRRRVATVCVVHGRTMRQAAEFLGVSLHTVRREMSIVDALFNATQPSPRSEGARR